jgi:hypothetical protein
LLEMPKFLRHIGIDYLDAQTPTASIPNGAQTRAAHQATGLPTSPPTPSPPASTTNEPDDQQQYQRADGGVDNRRNNTQAKMDTELRKQPTTDESAHDSNEEIADNPKPGALHDLAGQPSRNDTHH